MTREELYKALIAAKNGLTGENLFDKEEARKIIDGFTDEYVQHLGDVYKDAEEWVDYYTM